jgi:hypothetical protein
MSPSSSRLKNKQSGKPTELAARFMLISCLVLSLTLKIEAIFTA